MYEYALAQYAWHLQMLQGVMSDIDDANITRQPVPKGNHPAWIIGHLALSSDNLLKMMGQPTTVPENLRPLFGRGSEPQAERSIYPSKDALLQQLATVHTAVSQALPHVPREVLDRPNPVPLVQLQSLPTVGNLIMHLLTTHEAFHLGQLSAWRRAMGYAPLF